MAENIKNFTTIVPATQTIGEIQEMLADYGVSAMMTEYEGRQVAAVSFKMNVSGKEMAFRLPCNWHGVLEVFKKSPTFYVKHKDKDIENQAIRTSWRIIHAWIDAQLALVEVNMVTIPQIFLPYTIMGDGRTLAEHVESNPQFLIK
jgi:hypothetical protein